MSTSKSIGTKLSLIGKFAFIALIIFTFAVAHPVSTTYAKRKPAKYGTVKIRTTPGGLPLALDGEAKGTTTTGDRSFDLAPGVHSIVIDLPDGRQWAREFTLEAGRIKCVALNYRPGPPALPKSPCPFPVSLSAPSQVNEGEIITYTADVVYSGSSSLNYVWTVSPANARILSGAGTPTITVDSTGLGGQRISAVLAVNDGSGDPTCLQTSQATTYVPPAPPMRELPAREFDTCCSCTFDDQKARLDNLAIELQNDPTTTTYIIAYAGRNSRTGQATRLGARARDYLTEQRGLDASRIVVVDGGFREEDCVELWLVPSGANPPRPTPTVSRTEVRPPRERRRN